MPFKLSKEAQKDFRDIGRYTQKTWRIEQRRLYLAQLDETFSLLGKNPQLGRSCDDVRKGYFRFEYVSHIMFYTDMGNYVLISRILHKRMDVKSHIRTG